MKLAILCLLLPACSGACVGASPEFYVDARFTASERAAIQAAADEWHRATNGLATLDLRFDYRLGSLGPGHRIVVRVDGPADGDACGHDAKVVFGGATLEEHIYLGVGRKNVSLAASAIHEFGHSQGLSHVNDAAAIMYPVAMGGEGWCVTAADLVEFCAANGCRAEALSPCEVGR